LSVAPEVFGSLAEQAAAYVARVGYAEDGRPSLATCWLLGQAILAESVGAEQELPEVHPIGVAYLGARGDESLLALPGGALDAAGDRWFEALDAAGANDRIRAFTDAVARVDRQDNPQEHPGDHALVVELAGRPLALEPLPKRLLPAVLLQTDLSSPDDAYLGGPRRIPTSRGTSHRMSEAGAAELAEAFGRTWEDVTEDHGLAHDATLGDILEASGSRKPMCNVTRSRCSSGSNPPTPTPISPRTG
jgi:hypothetical protein